MKVKKFLLPPRRRWRWCSPDARPAESRARRSPKATTSSASSPARRGPEAGVWVIAETRRPADAVHQDRRHRRPGALRDSRSAEGELQRLGARLRPGRRPEEPRDAGEHAQSAHGARSVAEGGGGDLSGDVLVLAAQGAGGERVSARAGAEPAAVAEHDQERRLPVVPRPGHAGDAQGAGALHEDGRTASRTRRGATGCARGARRR